MPKTVLLYCITLFAALSTVCTATAQPIQTQELKCVVLDAGHGGKDYGCISRDKKFSEKKITLAVTLKLGKLIQENYPRVRVVYTRDRDVFIPLNERADIANRNKADLFISIHVNSAGKLIDPNGTETFTMGNHKSDSNFEISKRENSVILLEDDYTTKYEGFDPDSEESYIIFSLLQNAYSQQSIKLAQCIQNEYVKGPIRRSRGVKQAGFLVLWRTTMPSVLTELGFLSNPDDYAVLTTSKGQDMMAKRLFEAFEKYKKEYEKEPASARPVAEAEQYVQPVQEPAPETVQQPAQQPVQQPEPKEAQRPQPQTVQPQPVPEPVPAAKSCNCEEKARQSQEQPVQPQRRNVASTSSTTSSSYSASGITTYSIQILSVSRKLSASAPDLKGVKDAKYVVENGLYKYYIGSWSTRAEAARHLGEVRRKFNGAFIIGIKGNKRIIL